MKHACPHCGEKSFSLIQKALAGSLRSTGKPCPACGRKCCNGMASIYFSTAVSLVMLVACIAIYLTAQEHVYSTILIIAIILVRFIAVFVFDMFVGKLTEPIRIME